MELIYMASNLTVDAETVKNRIIYYIEHDDFDANGIDPITLTFQTTPTKEEMLKIDLSMASFGYHRA